MPTTSNSSSPNTLDPSSATTSMMACALRRGSAPPPVLAAIAVPLHKDLGSRKNSSPDVGDNGGSATPVSANSGPLSMLGIGKRQHKSNIVPHSTSPHHVSGALSGDYPVHRLSPNAAYETGQEMQVLSLHDPISHLKAMDEEDEYEDGSNLGATATDDYTGSEPDSFAGGEVNISLETLRDMLKCVGCGRFLFPPILQCISGHMECRNCFDMKADCPKCRQKMVEIPAKFAETITEQFKVQCSYSGKGCQETVPFKHRRDHEEVCPFKPVQCPEFDCTVTKPMNEIFKHFRVEHHHHFVNAHGNVFNGDIRCDDSNMVMGVERKWAPTMMKLDGGSVIEEGGSDHILGGLSTSGSSGTQHFFLEILRTKHGVWHMWIWYLGEPDEANSFRCEIAIRKKNREEDTELKYSGKVHSIRIPPHRIILSGCLLSFSDYTATHFRYLGEGHAGHPVIDYRVTVSRTKKRSSSSERAMTAGLTKMLRRFSIDSGAKANKPSMGLVTDCDYN